MNPFSHALGPASETQIGRARLTSGLALPYLLGLLVLWSGYFGPWVQHRVAALTMNGYDLAEWVTFLPGVRDGSLPFGRLQFQAPFALVLFLTAAWAWQHITVGTQVAYQPSHKPPGAGADSPAPAAQRRGDYSLRAISWAALALSVLGVLLLLPGYPFILFWRDDPEVQFQLALAAGTWAALALGGVLARFWGLGLILASLAAAAGGLLLAGWAFLQLRPVVAELYGATPAVGWGWVVMEVGFGVLGVGFLYHLATNEFVV